jgi:hypothetical protein
MYANVPVKELVYITKLMCNQNGLIEKLNQESINYCKILTQQNYIQYKGSQYIQEEGLAMSTPTLSIF